MEWIKKEDQLPEKGRKVVIYSSAYNGGNRDMLFRIIDGQFINITNEVTHWAYLEDPPN